MFLLRRTICGNISLSQLKEEWDMQRIIMRMRKRKFISKTLVKALEAQRGPSWGQKNKMTTNEIIIQKLYRKSSYNPSSALAFWPDDTSNVISIAREIKSCQAGFKSYCYKNLMNYRKLFSLKVRMTTTRSHTTKEPKYREHIRSSVGVVVNFVG